MPHVPTKHLKCENLNVSHQEMQTLESFFILSRVNVTTRDSRYIILCPLFSNYLIRSKQLSAKTLVELCRLDHTPQPYGSFGNRTRDLVIDSILSSG